MLQFASELMEFSQRLRSANELSSDDDIIKDTIEKCLAHTGQKFVENLIQETENARKEKTEVPNYFDVSNYTTKSRLCKEYF